MDGPLLDGLGGPPLIQVQQGAEQAVQVGLSALLLHPDVQQLVDSVLIRKAVVAFDHIVIEAQATEEPLVIVDVQISKEVEASPERVDACRETGNRR